MCKMITSVYCLDQRAANILYRSPDSKYFRLCRSWKLCLSYSALWLKHKGSHRWHVNSECGCVLLCCSVAKSCLTLCDPINCDMSGLLALHHLLEHTQTHVHWVGDAIQPPHLLSQASKSVLKDSGREHRHECTLDGEMSSSAPSGRLCEEGRVCCCRQNLDSLCTDAEKKYRDRFWE